MTITTRTDWPRGQLVTIFRDAGYTRGAEIGVWHGGFSEQLCQGIPGLQLLCVDSWLAYEAYRLDKKNDPVRLEDAYRECCRRLAPYQCMIRRQLSVEAAASVADGSLDFIFLDANHSYDFVLADLRAWVPKVRPGGMVAGHDFLAGGKGGIDVKTAVEDFCREHGDGQHLTVLAKDRYPSFFWVVS